MNKDDLRRGINRSWEYVKAVGVNGEYRCPTSLVPSEEFKEIAHSGEAVYEDIYLCGLRRADYNIILVDYSYLQFKIDGENEVRYAYYPNPFLGASIDAVQELSELAQYVKEGAIEMEEYLHRVSEIRKSQHPPLVRYENAPRDYKRMIHPCSHFHFGHHASNRWAVRRVLTPHAFTLVMLRHFYFHYWQACDGIRLNATVEPLDKVYTGARADCRILPDEVFAPDEGLQFHFC